MHDLQQSWKHASIISTYNIRLHFKFKTDHHTFSRLLFELSRLQCSGHFFFKAYIGLAGNFTDNTNRGFMVHQYPYNPSIQTVSILC